MLCYKMYYKSRLLICVFVVLCCCTRDAGGWMVRNDELFLSIYYESKCPDSKTFIINQLVPAMKLLKHHLSLRFVPFGKAMISPDGGYVCQHGPSECIGNIVQDCALHTAGPDFGDERRLAYVACEMSTEAGTRGSLQCVHEAGIPLGQVRRCLASWRGEELQRGSEYLTGLVQPKFIPTVTVNGVFNQATQDNAQLNLIETLCSLLPRASECFHYYNTLALAHLFGTPFNFADL